MISKKTIKRQQTGQKRSRDSRICVISIQYIVFANLTDNNIQTPIENSNNEKTLEMP